MSAPHNLIDALNYQCINTTRLPIQRDRGPKSFTLLPWLEIVAQATSSPLPRVRRPLPDKAHHSTHEVGHTGSDTVIEVSLSMLFSSHLPAYFNV